MSDNDPTTPEKKSFGPAAEAHISLAQAILAPMDALAKSQVHAARSFLNFLLQIGYPHKPHSPPKKPQTEGAQQAGTAPAESTDEAKSDEPDACYNLTFRLEKPNEDSSGNKYIDISIPTLALVPAHPLAIESADYSVELVVTHIEEHRQIQASEDEQLRKEMGAEGRKHAPRPWYLVSEPVSVRGNMIAKATNDAKASIKVNVKVKQADSPAGLAKLLTSMTQVSSMKEK